jgi:hypothetical protein
MHNSKFFDIIKTLDEKEFKNLSKHLKEYTSGKYEIYQLFLLVAKYYPDKLESKNLEKENVIKKLFPNEKFNLPKYYKLLNDLINLTESFLLLSLVEENELQKRIMLLSFYLKKKLSKYFEQTAKEIEFIFENSKYSKHIFKYKIEFYELLAEYELQTNNRYVSYQNINDSIHLFGEFMQLKYKNLSLINLKNDTEYIDNNHPLIFIHKKLHELLLNDIEDNLDECFELIKQYKDKTESEEIYAAIVILVDYCLKKIGSSKGNYLRKLFTLFVFMIDEKFVFEVDKTITPAIYKNITTVGLRLNEIDYINHFIEDYKMFLPEEFRDDTYSYNKANLRFYEKKYDEVLSLLIISKYKDIFYKISSRVLQIKTYFILYKNDETYFDLLSNSINAFKKFIYSNSEINDYYKNIYLNFYKYIYKIFTKTEDKKALAIIKNEIENTEQIAEKDWLIQSTL